MMKPWRNQLCRIVIAGIMLGCAMVCQGQDSMGASEQAAQKDSTLKVESSGLETTAIEFKLKDGGSGSGSVSTSGDVATMLVGLLGVLALIFGLLWLSKRFQWHVPGVGQAIRMQSVLSVGQKEKLMVVEIEGSRLLLGVTAHSINVLKTLDEETETKSSEFSTRIQALLKSGAAENA